MSTTIPSTNVIPFPQPEPAGFFRLRHSLLSSTNWQSLTAAPKALFIEIAGKYRPYNNDIPYSIRDAIKTLGVGQGAAYSAFQDLENHNLIVNRQRGSFDFQSRADRDSKWGLTEFALGICMDTNRICTDTNGVSLVFPPDTNRLLDLRVDVDKESERGSLPKGSGSDGSSFSSPLPPPPAPLPKGWRCCGRMEATTCMTKTGETSDVQAG
jgi:hypothetical protein